MTPKEKAQELFDKYKDLTLNVEYDDDQNNFTAKQCALIAVDELLQFENRVIEEWTNYFEGQGGAMRVERIYWEEVKKEIEKL